MMFYTEFHQSWSRNMETLIIFFVKNSFIKLHEKLTLNDGWMDGWTDMVSTAHHDDDDDNNNNQL